MIKLRAAIKAALEQGKRRVAEEVEEFKRPVHEYIAAEEAERAAKSASTIFWQEQYKRKKGSK